MNAAGGNFDVIVVGSGITGGWAAKEFCERGFKVLLLERGEMVEHQRDYPGEGLGPWQLDFRKDAVHPDETTEHYAVQSTNGTFRASTKQFYARDSDAPYIQRTPFEWIRAHVVGGRSLIWGRQCYRWSPLDFEANARDGVGTPWPIGYEDLEPWYGYVERFVGISGSKEELWQLPDSEFQPAMPMNCVEEEVKRLVERQFPDRKVIIGRCANLTRATQEQQGLGRSACQFRNECARGCSFGAYFSTQSATLPAARRTGNLTLRANSLVVRVVHDSQTSRVTGVEVIDTKSRARIRFASRVVFLCASTLGSTELLLRSRSDAFPRGLANSSGVLGRYLMDHVSKVGATGFYPGFRDAVDFGRRPTGIYIPRFRNLDDRGTDFLRGYGFQGRAVREDWRSKLGDKTMGASLKAEILQPGRWRFQIVGFGEMLPRASNYVELDWGKTDRWGLPQLCIHCRHGQNERRMSRDMEATAVEMLLAAGLTEVKGFDDEAAPGSTVHEMGTARMGHNPADSVLNGYNQSHDLPNLFVTDGSAMTSSACQNPSLTYMALTARAADYCSKLMKFGTL